MRITDSDQQLIAEAYNTIKMNASSQELMNEISQNKIQNNLHSLQSFRLNNPVASDRSNRFAEKAIDRAKARGRYFQLYPHMYNENEDKLEIIVKDAKRTTGTIDRGDESNKLENISMNVDYYNSDYNKWDSAKLILTLPTKITPNAVDLYFTTNLDFSDPIPDKTNTKMYTLKNSSDAKQLARCIFHDTGTNVSWKQLKFKEQ
jgi:hypothetical protein